MASASGILVILALLSGLVLHVQSAEPELILQAGQESHIACGLDTSDFQSLTWKRGQSYEEANELITVTRNNVTVEALDSEENTSYDVDSSNALIIRNVSKEDRGWYFCQILDLQNVTERVDHAVIVQSGETLPGGIVSTEHLINLKMGEQGLIPCSIRRSFYTLYWKKDSEILVVLDMYFDVGEKTGGGFDEGLFDVNQNYSLIIKNVQMEDKGRYYCEVCDFETGILSNNHTDVKISSVPDLPTTTTDAKDTITDEEDIEASTETGSPSNSTNDAEEKSTHHVIHVTDAMETARMTTPEASNSTASIIVLVLCIAGGVIAVIVVVSICYCLRKRRKQKKEKKRIEDENRYWKQDGRYEAVPGEADTET